MLTIAVSCTTRIRDMVTITCTVIFTSFIRNTRIEIWNRTRLDRRLGTRPKNHVVEMRMRNEQPHCVIQLLPNQITDCAMLFTLATGHNRFCPVQLIKTLLERWTVLTFPERLSCINSARSRLIVSIG